MGFYWLLLGSLGVWRIAHLLSAEDGPGNLLSMLRRRAGDGFWAGLLDCFYCLSLWVAVPFAYFLAEQWKERLVLWPALSGAAILLERVTLRERPTLPAMYAEDEEGKDVLRPQQDGIPARNSKPPIS